MYRCRYGACVKVSSICDKVPDCIDGSDEPPLNDCRLPQSYFQTFALISTPPSSSKTPKPTTKRYTPFEPTGWTQSSTSTPFTTKPTPIRTPATPIRTPATPIRTSATPLHTSATPVHTRATPTPTVSTSVTNPPTPSATPRYS